MGSVQAWHTGRFPWYQSTNEWITGEKSLSQRTKWIYKCGDIGSFKILAAHNWKRRRSYYFAETTSLLIEQIIDNLMVKTPNYAMPHRCYYLGSYPIYWDGKRETVTYAHVKSDGPRWALLKVPSHPTIPYWTPSRELVNEMVVRDDSGRVQTIPFNTDLRLVEKLDDWKSLYELQFDKKPTSQEIIKMGYFFGIQWELPPPGTPFVTTDGFPDPMWTSLDKQQQTIDAMDKVIEDCIKKNYLTDPVIPQKKIETPAGPAEWPGKPIPQLDLPKPVQPPGPPAPDRLNLTLTMGFTEPTSPDGLALIIEITKGPG